MCLVIEHTWVIFQMFVSQTKMVQHIRKKHPEFAQLANTIQAPLTTAVISSAPAVISADGATTEAVVVRKSQKTYVLSTKSDE